MIQVYSGTTEAFLRATLWLPSLDKSVAQAIYSAYTGPENPTF